MDCAASVPTCSDGQCVACTEHDQCASGACKDDGQCATANEIAYVNVLGGAASACTSTSPCKSIERALQFAAARPYVVIDSGTYTRTGPLMLADAHWLIGRGTPAPILDRVDDGPIIHVQGIANAHLDSLELTGATGDVVNGDLLAGFAVYCKRSANTPSVSVRRLSTHDVLRGLVTRGCNVVVRNSSFRNSDIELIDTNGTLDSNEFVGTNVQLDAGLFTFTNNVVSRVPAGGLSMYLPSTGNVVEFNTLVDASLSCEVITAQAFPNNILARSGNLPSGTMCSFPGAIVLPIDASALKFKHADSPPYDYHLLPGSSAIDTAVGTSSLDHDIDGDARPKGAGRDVGADEAQ